jgi:glutamate 5-kinase
VVPIINENDTVVTDEIKFGDNDTLGALVANLVEAEALVILTDQAGLYTADPRKDPAATLVAEHRADDPALEAMAGGAGSGISKGGMITKVRAAQRAARSGAHTLIASGREADVLPRLAQGEALGTLLFASRHAAGGAQAVAGRPPATGRQPDPRCRRVRRWLRAKPAADRRHRRGRGIRTRRGGRLPHADGREIARGLVNYSARKRAASRASPVRKSRPSSATSTSRN